MKRHLAVGLVLLLMPGLVFGAIQVLPLDVYRAVRIQAQLLTNAVALTDGEWVDMAGITNFSVTVSGITTATVEVDVSNAMTPPANNTHGTPIGAPFTADGLIQADVTVRWAKARVTAYTSGTINAILQGQP